MTTFQSLQLVRLTGEFHDGVEVHSLPLRPAAEGEVVVQTHYVGVNATDVKLTAAKFLGNGPLPCGIGLEALGRVHSVGPGVSKVSPGDAVLVFNGSACYAEFIYAREEQLFPVPDVRPEFLVSLINGLTAAIGLDECGRIRDGDRVLVTAAAGGTGHVAVQWAKRKGCFVIGVTSSDSKAAFLREVGVDHVINSKREDVFAVLARDYPDGVNVIWETGIAGHTLGLLLDHLAPRGRLVIIGNSTASKALNQRKHLANPAALNADSLAQRLRLSGFSISGFLLLLYQDLVPHYWSQLISLISRREIHARVDEGEEAPGGRFQGIRDVVRAVEHLQSGGNRGKAVVRIIS